MNIFEGEEIQFETILISNVTILKLNLWVLIFLILFNLFRHLINRIYNASIEALIPVYNALGSILSAKNTTKSILVIYILIFQVFIQKLGYEAC